MNSTSIRSSDRFYWRSALLPSLVYFVFFCVYTYPLIIRFCSHLFGDAEGDTLANLWNLWWVNKALVHLHTNPWYTYDLYHPVGISLLPHTLCMYACLMAIPLLQFLPLIQTYNLLLILSFVLTGLSTFWFCRAMGRSYGASLVGGGLFTFWNYHFAHGFGHMNLVNMQWIPLFLLFWFRLVTRPAIRPALAAALFLFLTLLCDYYYFFYCVLAGALIFFWRLADPKARVVFFRAVALVPLGVFIAAALLTSGWLVGALFLLNCREELLWPHNPLEFSLDLAGLFIPGGHWRFHELTEFYWSKLPGNAVEHSVHLGFGLLIVLALIVARYRDFKIRLPSLNLWLSMMAIFFALALGPTLHIFGSVHLKDVMPYAFLVKLIPPLETSGVPVRMTIMLMLSASLLGALGFEYLFNAGRGARFAGILLLVLLFFEYLPLRIPTSQVKIPEYVHILEKLPNRKGFIDCTVADPGLLMYHQTIHGKPIHYANLARKMSSSYKMSKHLAKLFDRGDFEILYRECHYAYYASSNALPHATTAIPIDILYQQGRFRLYRVGTPPRVKNK